MFAYIGHSNEEFNFLYSLLIKSSKDDVIGKKYGYPNHSDGFGIVIYNESNLFHFRSSRAIYSETPELPEYDGEIYAISHAMNSYNKSMIKPLFEHPFVVSNGNYVTFMAHNGVIDKESIMKYLNIYGLYNDTESALEYINKYGINKIDELEKYTKSSLNLIILRISKDTGKASIYFKNFYKDISKKDYSEMFIIKMHDGIAVVSSTIAYYCDQHFKEILPVSSSQIFNLDDLK
jgi:predicted glutamine amidotransferase